MFGLTIIGYTVATMWAVLFLIVWVAIAFWPARVASRKGYSGLLFFIISLFFFFLSLLIAYILPDKTKTVQSSTTPPSAPEA